jgi:hypothetical protein
MSTETEQPAGTNGESPWSAQAAAAAAADPVAERPELYVGAALVGGLVLAKLLKRLGGGD